MGLFLFLSVAVASVFTFIAVIAWAGERRKEREAYYHSEVVKKIAESPGSGGSLWPGRSSELDCSCRAIPRSAAGPGSRSGGTA